MVDPISVAMAGTETVKLCLELVHRVSTAIDLQKTGNSKLETISDDLASVSHVIKLVEAQEELKTKGVLKAVTSIQKITVNVHKYVERVKEKSSTGSKARQITYQFMKGPGEWETLSVMMIHLTAAKATLSLHIQMAHVGLTAVQGPATFNIINIKVLGDVNQNVEKMLGRGLLIAEIIKNKQPDGTILISYTVGTLQVLNNRTFDQALQINGMVGMETWGKFHQDLIIENNEARGFSTQINVPIKDETYKDALQNRLELAKAMAGSGSGANTWQPPPYAQWGYPAPPPMPGTQVYAQPPYPNGQQPGQEKEEVPRALMSSYGQQPLPQPPNYGLYSGYPYMVNKHPNQGNPGTKMDTAD
ncbi:hypothetical protein G7Z17_g229 [Cylindrodendrum hubeiense]|uniref:NACHT-NTPase and P-loop NTPases N-terminal domain-containing protein n=1 Tax=Cylindrodendrum hubeiense TaxID=595255 RepID=A0A9P5HH96_9HYPO|nr:hypothetical protein G7Z17_g229 [Cylindrodendrum hubeiense]